MNKSIRSIVLAIALILPVNLTLALTQDRYPFPNSAQQQQFNQLNQELRCLVCQNETLEASNSPLANDIRAKIYEMVKQGESNEVIIAYLTQRYGDFIRFKPPVSERTLMLWVLPFALLILGLAAILLVVNRARLIANQPTSLKPEQELQLKQRMHELDNPQDTL